MQNEINYLWENRQNKNLFSADQLATINSALQELDQGKIRVAHKQGQDWIVNDWLKKAILLYFMTNDSDIIASGINDYSYFDKVKLKFSSWSKEDFEKASIRAVPGAIARHGAYIGKNVVLMPSFINVGAYIDSGTLIDTWSTVGSCAQIGKNCHISGGVGIGGVLEPLQASPVIIEDNCFIGARSEIAEGVIIEEGSVISMGVFIGASTKIYNRQTGEMFYGRVPAYSVVVPGTLSNQDPHLPSLSAAIIVKTVDEKTRTKTSINEILRS